MKQIYDNFRSILPYWTEPEWLGGRMLFLSGPRQVGKTTLVISTLCPDRKGYYNWDNRKVREAYARDPDFFVGSASPWICFDEIHKRQKWKDILKGIFDSHRDQFRFVVTGSARLETFKKSGDSLVGRYFHTHLFPLNLADLCKNDFKSFATASDLAQAAAGETDASQNDLDILMVVGGFPEPFFSGSETFWKRWSANHRDLIIQEDLRDLTRIVEVDKIERLVNLLGPNIGSVSSYQSYARDLETTHGSIRRWLETLNRVHLIFPVSPYSRKISRAYKQEQKWYYMDWRAAKQNRFENYVAASLLRAVTLYRDRYGEQMDLHFIRTHDGAEVDFLLTRDGDPWLLIEAKEGQAAPTSAAYRFSAELKVPCLVVTEKRGISRHIKGNDGQDLYLLSWARLGRVLP